MALEASTDLLVGFWSGSPRLRGSIDAMLDPLRDDVLPALDQLQLMRAIDDAEGVWLDYLGVRYGLRRPSTTDPAADTRFGFDDAGAGFDQQPFRGDRANDSVYPLPDALYRKLVKARAILDLADGTPQTFARAVRAIDPAAIVRDNRDMTVTVRTNEQPLIELADAAGALPRTAGVRIIYQATDAFGFDQAGVGFDQAPFRAG